ncbi:MAG: flagellar biosynthesis protein FlgE [Deltaproteobacteria bacterium]|nr:MAG: flagellar biosynthesis protein FlgE [Deltaproteobacteria bacterium]
MALSSALFSGISGLSTLGNAMQIIGDNIANVNTVAFKGSTFSFQDLLSQSISTLSGTAQVGRGTALGDIYANFEQGSFESTGNNTDLAIGGDGFFVLREQGSSNVFYTRAGNFRFDKDGALINPEGYVVQGWELDENGDDMGSVTDIVLSSFTSPPEETSHIQAIVNLNSEGDDNSSGSDDALANAWDGTKSTPLSEDAYEYQTTLKVYDSLGSTHDVTIYFDKAATASAYEFIVTCNPGEDQRTGAAGNTWAGLLARGLIHFNSGSGVISDIDLWQINPATGASVAQSEATDLSNGYFTFTPTFLAGNSMTIELDFGSRYDGSRWANSSLSSTQFARASTTTFQSSNGYGAGDLKSVSVDVDGVITGSYSNGQLIPLYRVALAKFQNVQGLMKEGGNLFRETRESGSAITNKPGTSGLGSIAPNALEQSNVDIANEFVKMITTQRGFQANSKIITVTDQMLAELINLKR